MSVSRDGRGATSSTTGARKPGELTARELLRWTWRQVTSMRTALVLLLLLALAAVPGSVIPQSGVDSLAVSRWKDEHPDLTPIYEKLDLFSVYDSVWFSAIYLLLVVSLVGCIIPRTLVYLKAFRAEPPAAPRNLQRMPDAASYETDLPPEVVLERAREVLGRRYRLRGLDTPGLDTPGLDTPSPRGSGYSTNAPGGSGYSTNAPGGSGYSTNAPEGSGYSTSLPDHVAGERGRLREVGNLVFHLSVLVVLAGFAIGGLFGYQGGVIIVQANDDCPRCGVFSNTLTQYDDFDPGGLFTPDQLDEFGFTVEDFDATWLREGPNAGTAQGFSAALSYHQGKDGEERKYDLRVNHPLSIGDTDVFLIGHGYAPVITVRDGDGNVAYSGPTVFLPQDPSFVSYGVIKAPAAQPEQIGLDGLLYPTFEMVDGDPVSVFPDDLFPLVSMLVYSGDLGLDDGAAQSVYVLDKDSATPVTDDEGKPVRLDLRLGERKKIPGLGSVEFESVQPWVRVQISQTPGKEVALAGVVLALIGLCGSLFIRPRRVWVRARTLPPGPAGAGGDEGGATMGRTLVEVAVLDRSGNDEVGEVVADIVRRLQEEQVSQA